ncbi:MAG: Hsp33 family molecular chaperone HslO [Novosphingobium meiothermophilum]|uniref:Hsp33 family molecular chaperone HslO n=1 Tax=Novosphingobium TaxID=165696 RepID=UPI000D6E5AE4|nr:MULTISPECIES: Hsp33 family molecular chaperone HslO [Novosphingobium]
MTEQAQSSTGFDQVLQFTLPDRNARGRVVRLGPVLDTVLSAHAYPGPIRQVLSEALTITALLGSLLKDQDSQLTMQAQTQDGVIDLLVCDYRNGEVRGHVRHDRARLDELGPSPSLFSLFGEGYLAITFDLAVTEQRYQGVVPLEGASLAQACENYFFQSEQVPTLIRVGVSNTPTGCVAGGLLLQHLPEGEEGRERLHVQLDHPEWEHVVALGGSVKPEELVDRDIDLETVVWRLFHEEREIRIHADRPLKRGCRCTIEHYRNILSRFGAAEIAEMKNEAGLIVVDCAFCSKEFAIDLP